MTDQNRIARALLEEIEAHGGIADFMEKLIAYPEQYSADLAHTAMCEIARIETEKAK